MYHSAVEAYEGEEGMMETPREGQSPAGGSGSFAPPEPEGQHPAPSRPVDPDDDSLHFIGLGSNPDLDVDELLLSPRKPVEGDASHTGFAFGFLAWIVGFLGFWMAIGSLAVLQTKINDTGVQVWWSAAGYPDLPPMKQLRLDWFIVSFQFLTSCASLFALVSAVFRQVARTAIVGTLIVCSTLQTIAANRCYNILSVGDNCLSSAANAALTGFACTAASGFALLLVLGVNEYCPPVTA